MRVALYEFCEIASLIRIKKMDVLKTDNEELLNHE
jgi:hypothetical protein